ncbi:MAG: methyltransferase, partial [Alphaproteobacteria bacterium]
ASYLVKGERRYMGSSHEVYSDLWDAMLHTSDSIRAGAPQCMHDCSEMSRDELAVFMRGLDAGANAAGRKLVKDYGLTEYRHLLDVGGGSGGLARAICEAVPGLDATVTDLPTVASLAQEFNEKAGLAERIRILANDTVATPPEGGYDLAVLRNFLQVLGPEKARAALINVGKVMEPGGSVFIIGRVLDDSRLTPADTAGMNLVFLNIYEGGQSYTESRHREWLAEAGFENMTRTEIAGGYSIIRARKAG